MTDQPEQVRATWCGPPRWFPSLGIMAEPGERVEIPASLADEYPDWWQRVYDPEAAEYIDPGAPEQAATKPTKAKE